jgi:hypothetical protein
MARNGNLLDHDAETCAQCQFTIVGAQVAREMLEAGENQDVASIWAAETWRRWQSSKFFTLVGVKTQNGS